jgi:hypothetical protein
MVEPARDSLDVQNPTSGSTPSAAADASATADVAVTAAEIDDAAKRIRPYLHRTPVMTSTTLDELCGNTVFLKCENLQRSGAFKARGAFNALLQLSEDQRTGGVVAYSSGNHAQAVALAARTLGIEATILMPADTPENKAAAVKGYGAAIIRFDRYADDRAALAEKVATRIGATIIPPFDNPHIVAGQAETVLVQSRGMGRWLSLQLADAHRDLVEEVVDVPDVVATTLGFAELRVADGLGSQFHSHKRVARMQRFTRNLTHSVSGSTPEPSVRPPLRSVVSADQPHQDLGPDDDDDRRQVQAHRPQTHRWQGTPNGSQHRLGHRIEELEHPGVARVRRGREPAHDDARQQHEQVDRDSRAEQSQ